MTVRAHLIGNPALLQAILSEPRIGAQDRALDMIRDGFSYRKIGAHLGVHHVTISRLARQE